MKVLFLDFYETLYTASGVFSDTFSFLEKMKDKIMLVLLSEEDKEQLYNKLDSFGIRSYFGMIVASHEYEIKKPDPKLVNVAIALVKDITGEDVKKDDCFLLGTRPDIDIKMGNAAGIRTIRVLRGNYSDAEPEYDDENATYCVKSLKEAADVLLTEK